MSDAAEAKPLKVQGQFAVTHSFDKKTGYTQLCITLRDRPEDVPIIVVDGVNGDVHVGVYDDSAAAVRIDRNGAAL